MRVDPAQNLANAKGGYVCTDNKPIEALGLVNSFIHEVCEHKTKDVQGQATCNIKYHLVSLLL